MKTSVDPSVLHQSLANGEAVLVHSRTASYYSLNETGYRIWCLLASGLSLDETARRVQQEYDVAEAPALDCVTRLAQELAAEGLLELTDESEGG